MENQYLFWYLVVIGFCISHGVIRGLVEWWNEEGFIIIKERNIRLMAIPSMFPESMRIQTTQRDFEKFTCREIIPRDRPEFAIDHEAYIKDHIARALAEKMEEYIWWREDKDFSNYETYIEGNVLIARGY